MWIVRFRGENNLQARYEFNIKARACDKLRICVQ